MSFEIIGVVADAQNTGLQKSPRPEVYLPPALTSAFDHNLIVRTSADNPAIIQEIRTGLFSSYFLTRLIASEVWGVSVTDPITFTSVAFLALLVGLLACLLPARRASRVDPMVALRYE